MTSTIETAKRQAQRRPVHPDMYNDSLQGEIHVEGLRIRQLFAAMIMQGFCSNPKPPYTESDLPEASVRLADELLAELDKGEA